MRSEAIPASSSCCCASSPWWLALVGPPSTALWWEATPTFAPTSRTTSTSTWRTYEGSWLASDAGYPCRCKPGTQTHGYVIVTFCSTQRHLLDFMYMTVVLHLSTLKFLALFNTIPIFGRFWLRLGVIPTGPSRGQWHVYSLRRLSVTQAAVWLHLFVVVFKFWR